MVMDPSEALWPPSPHPPLLPLNVPSAALTPHHLCIDRLYVKNTFSLVYLNIYPPLSRAQVNMTQNTDSKSKCTFLEQKASKTFALI